MATPKMDYKYIEQLIERYFAAETSVEEEHILRDFFAQAEVPAHLQQWQPLFAGEAALSAAHLDDDFDERLLAMTGERHVHAKRITLTRRLRPLFTAAAFIAFAIVIGTAIEQTTATGDIESAPMQVAVQDELDPTETTPLDIRSAELANPADTIVGIP